MTIDEMKRRKRELGYSFRQISELSGVPLGTVQKVFSGETKNPRYQTLKALGEILKDSSSEQKTYYNSLYRDKMRQTSLLQESAELYRVDFTKTGKFPEKNRTDGYFLQDDGTIEGPYTYDDYMALPDDCQVELIYGVFYDLASPRYSHQRIQSELIRQLMNEIDSHGMNCDVVGDMDTRVMKDDKTVVRPDIAVICHPESSRFKEERIWGAPDLVIEIISPSSRTRDMNQKLRLYRDAGVREYWIIDSRDRIIYQIVFDDKAVLHVHSTDDTVEVGISGGKIKINLRKISGIFS